MKPFNPVKVSSKNYKSFDSMLRAFNRKVAEEGILKELKRRTFHLSTSEKRKAKDKIALSKKSI